MATSAFALMLIVTAFIYPTSTLCSYVSSKGPRALLSNVSPLNSHDDQSLTSILSMQSKFTSEINFCSLANRACSSELNHFKPFATVYEVYEGIDNQSPAEKVDSSSFFRQSALKFGNKIHRSKLQGQFPEPASVPVQRRKIVYAKNELQKLTSQSFIAPTTKEATQSALLNYCNTLKGSKVKSCSKSLEEMIEFSEAVLGGKHLVALTTKSTKVSGAGKELLIGDVKKMNVDKMVTCHGVLLDTAIYFCHSVSSSTPAYVIDVIDPETKAPINTVLATCHMDTSAWSEDHVAFEMLKSSPGKIEACHWNTDLDILWVVDH